MKQVMANVATANDYHAMKIVLYQDEKWSELDTSSLSILEVSLPQDTGKNLKKNIIIALVFMLSINVLVRYRIQPATMQICRCKLIKNIK